MYPFYQSGNGDLYFQQIILCNSVYKNPRELLASINDYRQYFIDKFLQLTSLNDRINRLADVDIQIHNDIEIAATTEIRSMYNLHTSNNDHIAIEDLSPDQYNAYSAIINSSTRFIIVQGGSGTQLLNHYGSRLGRNNMLTATTGLAAYLINVRTVHSRLMLFRHRVQDRWVTSLFDHDNIHRLLQNDIIIVDEYSMMDAEMLNKIMGILNDPRLQHIKLVLCGDLNQLPPVVGDALAYTTIILILLC